MNMENSLDMQISNVGLGTREFVASLDGSTEDPLAGLPDQTLSEQANDQIQSQLDEIEGTDVIGEKERQAASDAEVENLNSVFTSPVLYRTQDTMQFTGTYASLKDMVDYLADQTGRMTLDNVNASFDSTTGNLTGSVTVKLFSMAGTGKTYTEPDAGSVAYGTSNIFGTIESGKKSKKSKKSKKKAQRQLMHRVQTTRQTRRLPILALTARIPTVRKEKYAGCSSPAETLDRHNKESMLEGRVQGPSICVFMDRIKRNRKKRMSNWE